MPFSVSIEYHRVLPGVKPKRFLNAWMKADTEL